MTHSEAKARVVEAEVALAALESVVDDVPSGTPAARHLGYALYHAVVAVREARDAVTELSGRGAPRSGLGSWSIIG